MLFLLVGSYTMLSWQLIKEVLKSIKTLTSKHNLIFWASYTCVVNLAQTVQGLADYTQKLNYHAMQAAPDPLLTL